MFILKWEIELNNKIDENNNTKLLPAPNTSNSKILESITK